MSKPKLAAFAVLLLGAMNLARAQKALPASTETPDEAITLSEFSVKADPNPGNIASECMTGTRVATKIADLPEVRSAEKIARCRLLKDETEMVCVGRWL